MGRRFFICAQLMRPPEDLSCRLCSLVTTDLAPLNQWQLHIAAPGGAPRLRSPLKFCRCTRPSQHAVLEQLKSPAVEV